MFLKSLTTGKFRQYLLLGAITLLIWGGIFVKIPEVSSFEGLYLQALIFSGLPAHSYLAIFGAFVLMAGQALLLNQLLRMNRYTPYRSSLAAFLFIVLYSHSTDILTLHPLSLPLLLLIVVFSIGLGISPNTNIYYRVFYAAFLIGISALIYPPAVLFILFLWIILIVNGYYRWREWVISLLGFLNPFFLISGLMFYFDYPMETFLNGTLSSLRLPEWPKIPGIVESFFIVSVSGFTIVAFLRVFKMRMGKPVSFRVQTVVIFWFLAVSLLSAVVSGSLLMYHLALVSVPVVAILSAYLSESTRTVQSEILLIFILLLVLIQNYNIL
jgi:hypothetical protein